VRRPEASDSDVRDIGAVKLVQLVDIGVRNRKQRDVVGVLQGGDGVETDALGTASHRQIRMENRQRTHPENNRGAGS